MKKLLLTLFAVAAIVACDKDAFDQDTYDINVVEAAEEINATVETASEDSILTLLENLRSANLPKAERGDANATAKGSDYLNLTFFTFGNEPYITFLDESNDDITCILEAPGVTNVNSIFFDNVNGDGSAIAVETADETVVTTVTGDFAAFFAGSENSIIKLTPTYDIVASEALNAHNRVTVSGADIKLACAADYFDITNAPFPLNGFLATIDDVAGLQAAFGGSSLNYAGTTESSVMDAIKANIMDGN